MPRGDLFVLSAPSGTGKTTLIRGLISGEQAVFVDVHFSISHTTRPPRASEIDGEDYHFVDVETFQKMIVDDLFLEWAEVHNNYYGTSMDEVVPFLSRGEDVLMDVDVQGAERVLAEYRSKGSQGAPPISTGVHSIFIMPPSYQVLDQRLNQRDLDDPEQIMRRLAVSRREIRRVGLYDYVIVNEDAKMASHILASIILDKRHRRERMKSQIDRVLDDFRQSAGDSLSGPEGDQPLE